MALAALSVTAICLAATSTSAATITFPNFSDTSGLTLNGSATTAATSDGVVLRLTPAAVGQAGSAFSTNQITLGVGNTFSTFFQCRMTNPGGIAPADGIVFGMRTVANNVGGAGGGMGYLGIPSSLGVEFDTFPNGAGAGDPNGNHVAVDTGGLLNGSGVIVNGQSNCTNIATVAGMPNCMANGQLWSAWIDYDGTNLFVALAQNSIVRPADIIAAPFNLPSILGQNSAFVGFTAGTGSGFENQDIINWQFTNTFAPIQVDAVPEPATMLLLGSGLAALVARRRWQK